MGRVLETSQHLGDGPCGNIVIVMLFLTANYVLFYAKYVILELKCIQLNFLWWETLSVMSRSFI